MSFLVKEQVYPMSKCGIRTFVIRKISISWFSYFRHGLGCFWGRVGDRSMWKDNTAVRKERSPCPVPQDLPPSHVGMVTDSRRTASPARFGIS